MRRSGSKLTRQERKAAFLEVTSGAGNHNSKPEEMTVDGHNVCVLVEGQRVNSSIASSTAKE